MRLRYVLSLSLVLVVLLVSSASAQIYRYERDDGTIEFTSELRDGAEAVETYGGAAPARRERVINMPDPDRANPNPDRSPTAFDTYIAEAAEAYSLPFEFIKAVMRVESAFDPHAVSHAGAMGLMQLMPATAESLNCDDPFDARSNIMAGTQFLRVLSNRYNGDINLVLAAYNAGSGAVSQYEGIPYEATRRYIERVWEHYQEYLAAAPTR